MTKALLEWETIDADQINDIMAGREPRRRTGPLTKRTPPSGGIRAASRQRDGTGLIAAT
jgi:cell division protease FtsH